MNNKILTPKFNPETQQYEIYTGHVILSAKTWPEIIAKLENILSVNSEDDYSE
jgi:hypothetical protein